MNIGRSGQLSAALELGAHAVQAKQRALPARSRTDQRTALARFTLAQELLV
jgi:hypothetical protein